MKLARIEEMLRNGARLKGFRSGGGLRVISLDLGGYGESPQLEEALEHCELNIAKGFLSYREMYSGEDALFPHYWTGALDSATEADAEMKSGSKLHAWAEKGVLFVRWEGYHETEIPEEITKRVMETGEPETYKERDIIYLVSPFTFPGDGTLGTTIKAVHNPGKKSFLYRVKQDACGTGDLYSLIIEALNAPKIEILEEEPTK